MINKTRREKLQENIINIEHRKREITLTREFLHIYNFVKIYLAQSLL